MRSLTFKNRKKISSNKTKIGIQGEYFAARYLTSLGYEIITTNWRTKLGEIDIIAREGEYLVFVEVKSRRENLHAREWLFNTIDYRKRNKLKALAQLFIKINFRTTIVPKYRVDLVGVIFQRDIIKPVVFKLVRGVEL